MKDRLSANCNLGLREQSQARLAIYDVRGARWKSGRGQPHSKTLRAFRQSRLTPIGLEVRLPSAAFVLRPAPDKFDHVTTRRPHVALHEVFNSSDAQTHLTYLTYLTLFVLVVAPFRSHCQTSN